LNKPYLVVNVFVFTTLYDLMFNVVLGMKIYLQQLILMAWILVKRESTELVTRLKVKTCKDNWKTTIAQDRKSTTIVAFFLAIQTWFQA